MAQQTQELGPLRHSLPRVGRLRLVPELNIAALSRGLDKELAAWYILRFLNSSGSGSIDNGEARKEMCGSFAYSRSSIYRMLKAGEGIFWQREGPRIRLLGLVSVANVMGCCSLSRFIEVNPKKFLTLSSRRALMYATAAHGQSAGRPLRPVSRQILEQKTGVKRRTQQRYDALAEVETVPQFAFDETAKGHFRPLKVQYPGKVRMYTLQRQLPNAYKVKTLSTRRGMCRKAKPSESCVRGEASLKPLVTLRISGACCEVNIGMQLRRSTPSGTYISLCKVSMGLGGPGV